MLYSLFKKGLYIQCSLALVLSSFKDSSLFPQKAFMPLTMLLFCVLFFLFECLSYFFIKVDGLKTKALEVMSVLWKRPKSIKVSFL